MKHHCIVTIFKRDDRRCQRVLGQSNKERHPSRVQWGRKWLPLSASAQVAINRLASLHRDICKFFLPCGIVPPIPISIILTFAVQDRTFKGREDMLLLFCFKWKNVNFMHWIHLIEILIIGSEILFWMGIYRLQM